MKFELTVALKYLIPRWRQLSVSIISLISVLVISLVVWLVVLFLSVTDGIEKKWVEQLVALNAPVRMAPTEAYYRSYYYLIDEVSLDSNYTAKTIGEKLETLDIDPYDPTVDVELPYDFPVPDRRGDGTLKDPVKEGYEAIASLHKDARAREYEVSFGNLRLGMLRDGPAPGEVQQTFLTQVSYVASHDTENSRLKEMLLPPTAEDYNNLLLTLSHEEATRDFFNRVQVTKVQTTEEGFVLPPSFFPEAGELKGVGIVRHNEIRKVVIPASADELTDLEAKLSAFGLHTTLVDVIFDEEQLHVTGDKLASPGVQLVLNDLVPFEASLDETSLAGVSSLFSLKFKLNGSVQGIPLAGTAYYDNLEIAEATPLEEEAVPFVRAEGDGVIIAKQFQQSGVRLGDQGHLSYYTPTASSMHEQRIPVYVAGFYDPGMMPVGNKLMFVAPDVVAQLRGNMAVSDEMLGNGVNIWLDDITQAENVKHGLIAALKARGIDSYWKVESYEDYDFAKPVLQQLKSDKNLFTLIALIILLVACSNIISMLILLVNDKRREIGIMQSMGASPRRIATIFGLCGFVMGLVSCVIGTLAAIWTLHHLQALVNFLSFLQGHEAFQAAFYGSGLPNELSVGSLVFVLVATMIISLIAGIVPAIKAARIRPTEILRAD